MIGTGSPLSLMSVVTLASRRMEMLERAFVVGVCFSLLGVGSLQIPVAGSQTWSVMMATWLQRPRIASEMRRHNSGA